MAEINSGTLDKYLVEVRRIAESREKSVERKILKLYKELIKDLYGFLGEEYINYSDDDGKLTRTQLTLKGEYARFLEEVNKKVNGIPEKVRDEVSELINETYEQCWQGMIDGVSKSKNVQELHEEFSSIRAVRPEVVKAAAENPIPKLRLTPTLEQNRKDVIYEIKREIGVGLSQGDTMATMARRITKRVDINYRQSMLIARTEAHRVRETGLNDASQKVDTILKEHGSEYRKVKIWNTSGDSSVRDTHKPMDGVAVLVDEEFELPSGAKAKCPGTSGVAAEDCNCRCFLTYDIVTDSEFYQLTGRHFPERGLTTSGKSGIIKENEGAEPASVRFVNSSDNLYKNAKNIEPIEGYEDIVIHGDKTGFCYYDKNGHQFDYTVREFAEVLKQSDAYNGGDIRLFACESGADGATAAQSLAILLNVNVMAPSDIVWVMPDGNVTIGKHSSANDGEWKIFKPRGD